MRSTAPAPKNLLREKDLNLRPPGYGPGGLPNCPIPQKLCARQTAKARPPIIGLAISWESQPVPPQSKRVVRWGFALTQRR
jgi:hypothetical protein